VHLAQGVTESKPSVRGCGQLSRELQSLPSAVPVKLTASLKGAGHLTVSQAGTAHRTRGTPGGACDLPPARPGDVMLGLMEHVVTEVRAPGLDWLLISFSDGLSGYVSLTGVWLRGDEWSELADPEFFARVVPDTESGGIRWDNGLTMDPELLYHGAKLHPVSHPKRGPWQELAARMIRKFSW
jgi:Protein of unknown function (DUF2442)